MPLNLNPGQLKHYHAVVEAMKRSELSRPVATIIADNLPPLSSSSVKLLLIRHGEAGHNLFLTKNPDKDEFHPECPSDPQLTNTGVGQAMDSCPRTCNPGFLPPTMALVSPLQRAIQTALLAFPHLAPGSNNAIPFVANDLLSEECNGSFCDLLSPAADLRTVFFGVNFDEYERNCDFKATNAQRSASLEESKEKVLARGEGFLDYLRKMPRDPAKPPIIAVASHSQWLQAFCVGNLDFVNRDEGDAWFATGEMRAVNVELGQQ